MTRAIWPIGLGFLVALLVELGGLAAGADTRLLDLGHRLAGPRIVPSDLVIVAIDDESVRRERDPLVFWGPHFAAVLVALREAGVTAVAMDLLLLESAETWFARHDLGELPQSRTLDAPLRAELARGAVVLASSHRVEGAEIVRDLPSIDTRVVLPEPLALIGLTDLPLDPDNALRRFHPAPLAGAEGPQLALTLAAALRHLSLDPGAQRWDIAGRTVSRSREAVPVAWAGPPGTMPTVPFWRLREGVMTEDERRSLGGRVALMGVTFAASGDWVETPYGDMRGVEAQANVLHTLLSGRRPWSPPRAARLAAYGLLGGLGASAALFGGWGVAAAAGALAAGAGPACALWGIHLDLALPGASAAASAVLAIAAAGGLRLAWTQRESSVLRTLFGRYVSRGVLDRVIADPRLAGVGGERRHVAVLFSDVMGFTSVSERVGPEAVFAFVNGWFEVGCRPILEQGGEVDKFIGDAIMARWGAPAAVTDPELRAVRAALGMAEAAVRYRAAAEERFGIPGFDVGIAVHAGPAVAGNIGLEERVEYTVIGDTVNTAARMEGLTRSVGARVLVSDAIVRVLGDRLVLGKRAELPVKGKAAAIVVHELLGLKDA